MISTTPFRLAERFIGVREVPGTKHNPQILAMLKLDSSWADADEVPWCSAFVNYVAWLLRLPRSKSLRARSWLDVGTPVMRPAAEVGFDVVILKQPGGPGVDEPNAPGHVGFFAGLHGTTTIYLLGGNQGNEVNLRGFPTSRILGIRRLRV